MNTNRNSVAKWERTSIGIGQSRARLERYDEKGCAVKKDSDVQADSAEEAVQEIIARFGRSLAVIAD